MNRGFRLETGPQVGFLLNSKAKYTDNRADVDLKTTLKPLIFHGFLEPAIFLKWD